MNYKYRPSQYLMQMYMIICTCMYVHVYMHLSVQHNMHSLRLPAVCVTATTWSLVSWSTRMLELVTPGCNPPAPLYTHADRPV